MSHSFHNNISRHFSLEWKREKIFRLPDIWISFLKKNQKKKTIDELHCSYDNQNLRSIFVVVATL